MKKYLLWWLAIAVLWILVYLGLPYIRFWLLYWFNHEQVERYKSMTKDFTLSEKYNLYTQWYRKIRLDDFVIDVFILDDNARTKEWFTEKEEKFIKEYKLEYRYRKYMRDGDKTLFKKINDIVEREYY